MGKKLKKIPCVPLTVKVATTHAPQNRTSDSGEDSEEAYNCVSCERSSGSDRDGKNTARLLYRKSILFSIAIPSKKVPATKQHYAAVALKSAFFYVHMHVYMALAHEPT